LTFEARFDRRARAHHQKRQLRFEVPKGEGCFCRRGPGASSMGSSLSSCPTPKNHRSHSDAQIAGYRWQYHGLWFRLPADRFQGQHHRRYARQSATQNWPGNSDGDCSGSPQRHRASARFSDNSATDSKPTCLLDYNQLKRVLKMICPLISRIGRIVAATPNRPHRTDRIVQKISA
jgi:hypothetical protein